MNLSGHAAGGVEEESMSRDAMRSRERVLAAVRGQPVDRVPVLYWLNPHMACRLVSEHRPARSPKATMIGRTLWRRFVRGGMLEAGEWTRALPNLFIGYGNGPYLAALGSDLAFASIGSLKRLSSMLGMIRRENGRLRVRDPLGCVRGVGGIYLDVVKPPVSRIEDLRELRLPPLEDTTDIRVLRRTCPGTCIMAEVSGVQQILSDILWDTASFSLALYDRPSEIKAFQARLAAWAIAQARSAVAAGADIVFIGDDYGDANRLRISPAMWREFTLPHLARIVAAVHDLGAIAMLHSCGHQMPLLPDYADAGLDVLQSLQPKAGNNLEAAVRTVGDRLCLATGIDTQRGESMDPAGLRADIVRAYQAGRTKGRFILGMTHMMQYTMPMENVREIFDTVRDIQEGAYG
jgi:uroporphyrinogen-III decarboxylase